MLDGDTHDAVAASGLLGELAHLTQCHGFVSLVCEPQNIAAGVIAAGAANEGDGRTGRWIGDGGFQRGDID